MKFKGIFGSPLQLSKLVTMLSKLSDSCLVHLTPDLIALAISADSNSGVQVCAEVSQRSLFLDYRIESRAENNRISFFAKLDNLNRALRSCCSSRTQKTQVKLTKKMNGGPTLTFEIVLSESQVQVLHDVPLRIAQDTDELQAYSEPIYKDGRQALSLVLPSAELRGLRNVIERMRLFSDQLLLTATGTTGHHGNSKVANLTLQVQKDHLVTISTSYSKLERVPMNGSENEAPPQNSDSEDTAEARVEVKRLSKMLQGLVSADMKMHNGICCIIPGQALVLKVFLPSLDQDPTSSHIVFYTPVQL